MCRTYRLWYTWLSLLVMITIPTTALAQASGAGRGSLATSIRTRAHSQERDVTPPDVYARVTLLQDEIDLIRFEMGRPTPFPGDIEVVDVAPHEVYFQAQTLLKKSNRLNFEHTREVTEAPQPPHGEATPADVMVVIDHALDRIRHVKEKLGITAPSDQPPPDPSRTPTDVFQAIVQANRQVNLLLEQRFSPADVYEQMTLAIAYAARLRAQFPGHRMPKTPALVRGKRPVDVYRKLLDCFAIIRGIAKRSHLSTLSLTVRQQDHAQVRPSDVYDIVTILIAELAYLHAQIDNAPAPRPAYYPGRKLPSQVYQRAGLFERQLIELETLVAAHPSWLRRMGGE